MAKPTSTRGPVPLETLALDYAQAAANRRAIEGAMRQALLAASEGLSVALREAVTAEVDCQAALLAEVDAHPDLFASPRKSWTVHGVTYGWAKGPAVVEIDDPAKTIALIDATLPPEQALLLIQTEKRIIKKAVKDLDGDDQKRLGIRQVPGSDAPFVRLSPDAVAQIVKAMSDELLAAPAAQEEAAA